MNKPIAVLIVDDHRTTRWALSLVLKAGTQFEVVGEVANGREAVEFVEEHAPDVVVMDVQMPEMDGLEATRRIKQSWPETRVIMISSSSLYARDAMLVGADMFLPKEQSFTQLRDAILALMGQTLPFCMARVTA